MLAYQKNKTKLFFGVLSLPSTAMGLALTVQLSALSWILTTQYQLDVHDIGLVWAAGPLAGIFGQVIIGGLSDRAWFWNGRRRPFILIGGVFAALSLLALPQIGVISDAMGLESVVGIALIIALTLDFAVNVGFNPTRSIIADVTESGDERTRGYTWMQTISGSIGVGGYAIGAIWDNYVLIYSGAIGVLLMAVLPPLFIEEPREIETESEEPAKFSFVEMLMNIKPLWGFLIYDTYAMTLRLAGIKVENFYAEIVCGILTLFLVGQALFKKPVDDSVSARHAQQFQRVLAAHSFSWIGIHTTFVYMVVFIQQQFPDLSDIDGGRATSLSFLILNAVGALLPLFVLGPLSNRIGKVHVHAYALFVMAAAYVGAYLFGNTLMMIYILIGFVGVGWASIVSLPFAIMSQKVDEDQMGLYMGLFNLSVVLPQLTVSLGIAALISRIPDKSSIWVISAVAIALSAVAWLRVEDDVHDDTPVTPGSAH